MTKNPHASVRAALWPSVGVFVFTLVRYTRSKFELTGLSDKPSLVGNSFLRRQGSRVSDPLLLVNPVCMYKL
jgi:hypothetical protein